MALLTIGAFARAARLSPKALRLYAELGLLRPAAVDPDNGYRFYDPAQLERARLVARLRRIGMPVARIRTVCDLPSDRAAAEVAAYWEQVRVDNARRAQLAAFLVDQLRGRGSVMSDTHVDLGLRHAARTDPGPVRTSNEDTAYAGSRLLAVADGTRGPGGDRASAAAVDVLRALESTAVPAGGLLNALGEAVDRADRAVGEIAREVSSGTPVTTLTAMLWTGGHLALAHIGDTRACLLRDGGFRQLTTDHSYVRALVDEGRLSPAEADSHPQRALLVRALDGTGRHHPELAVHPVRAGDRYLLCSDGLWSVLPPQVLRDAAGAADHPEQVVDQLVELACRAGAPDNIACVVADVMAL
ncbi:MAG TPA: MerR family transcriptional regulator [Micromonospora sp.]